MAEKHLLLMLSCLVVSCSVGPNYTTPEFYNNAALKQELSLQKSHNISEKWYKSFADEQLNLLIEQGLKNNTDIDAAVARLHQARAIQKINKVAFWPQIGGRGGYTYEKNSKNIGPTADTDYYSVGFDASWEIDLWGKGRRNDEASAAQVKMAEYSLNNVRVSVVAEIALNYINLKLSEEKLRIARQNLRLQRDIFSTVKAKYQSGLSDDIAYNQAEYLLSTTEAQIPTYQTEIESYKNALSVLSGILPSGLPLNSEKSPIFNAGYKYNTSALYNLPADVVRSRPDVAAAEQNLIAQNALIGVAVADLYPNISVTALWGYAAGGGNSLFNSKSQGYNYEPLVTLPLLDWNRLQNKIEQQKEVKKEALAQYKKSVLNAVSELKNSMIAVQNELKSNQAQNRALIKMSRVVEATANRYQSGLIDFSELLQAEQNLLSAQNNSLESRARIFRNLVAYYKAGGGGYRL